MSDFTVIELGSGERPSTGDDLRRLLLMAIAADNRAADVHVSGEPSVEADMAGADITRAVVELPTVDIAVESLLADSDDPREPKSEHAVPAEVAGVEPAVLREGRALAPSVLLGPARLAAGIDVRNLPVAWVRRVDGALSLAARDEPSDATGTAWAEAGSGDVEDLLRQVVLAQSSAFGAVRVRRLRLAVDGPEPDVVLLSGEVGLRWRVFGAGLSAVVRLRAGGPTVIVEDVQLRSGNPLVRIVLAIAQKSIAGVVGTRLDPQTAFPASLQVSRTGLSVHERRVRFEVTFGAVPPETAWR